MYLDRVIILSPPPTTQVLTCRVKPLSVSNPWARCHIRANVSSSTSPSEESEVFGDSSDNVAPPTPRAGARGNSNFGGSPPTNNNGYYPNYGGYYPNYGGYYPNYGGYYPNYGGCYPNYGGYYPNYGGYYPNYYPSYAGYAEYSNHSDCAEYSNYPDNAEYSNYPDYAENSNHPGNNTPNCPPDYYPTFKDDYYGSYTSSVTGPATLVSSASNTVSESGCAESEKRLHDVGEAASMPRANSSQRTAAFAKRALALVEQLVAMAQIEEDE